MWGTKLQWFPGGQAKGNSFQKTQSLHEFITTKECSLATSILLYQNQPSAEKLKEGKRKVPMKKKTKQEVTKEREDECFSCGDGGQIVSCKKPGCPKVYHADCLNLAKRPAGKWRWRAAAVYIRTPYYSTRVTLSSLNC